jgi:hypothetical protein
MMTEPGTGPEYMQPAEHTTFAEPDFVAACERALYGDGIAVVERVGLSEETRSQVRTVVLADEPDVEMDDDYFVNIRYFSSFNPEEIAPVLDATLAIGNFDEPYDAVNMQVNQYGADGRPSGIGPHYDFGNADGALGGGADLEALTIIYVLSGTKTLTVWPHSPGSDAGLPQTIRQQPDMLIVLRGGAIDVDGQLHSALRHQVPVQSEESMILTFDLCRRSMRQQALAEGSNSLE